MQINIYYILYSCCNQHSLQNIHNNSKRTIRITRSAPEHDSVVGEEEGAFCWEQSWASQDPTGILPAIRKKENTKVLDNWNFPRQHGGLCNFRLQTDQNK